MANEIKRVCARQVLDSRGNPTVEADVNTKQGLFCGIVPSGASTGAYEAVELRDTKDKRYLGKGVYTAVQNVNEIIAPEVMGMDAMAQERASNFDCSSGKTKIGFT